jgi:hypothetical protein
MLRDMDDKGGIRELRDIDYRSQFDRKWLEFTPEEQQAIDEEIERLLDALRDSPDPLWGIDHEHVHRRWQSQSLQRPSGRLDGDGGRPASDLGTSWTERHSGGALLRHALEITHHRASGTVDWNRSSDERPTSPNRHINLPGKTYFLATQR